MTEEKSLAVSPTALIQKEQHEIQVRQTEALVSIGESLKQLSAFLTGGGINQLLSAYSKSQAVTGMLAGLSHHAGRGALNAQTMGQNALEIAKAIEMAHDTYERILKDKHKHDPDLHDAEKDFKKAEENGKS